MPVSAADIARFIRSDVLTDAPVVAQGPNLVDDDPCGLWQGDGERVARKLVWAVEPTPDDATRAIEQGADVLLAHRPWRMGNAPDGLTVLAFHRALDDVLATGYNPMLARLWRMSDVQPLGATRRLSALGMIGTLPEPDADWPARVVETFGAVESHVVGRSRTVQRVAVVGALRADLVERAAVYGADAYVTGQMRGGARSAVLRSGLHVTAVGHARGEEWAMQQVARMLAGRFSHVEVIALDGGHKL